MSPNNPNQPKSPYANAAGAYDQHAQKHTPDQREVEARVLLKANRAFKELQKNWSSVSQEDLNDVLTYNRQIWLMFVDTAMEDNSSERPKDLRTNIANLGVFIFNHTLDVLATPAPEKLDILIEINSDIAAGLMTRKQPDENAAEESKTTPENV